MSYVVAAMSATASYIGLRAPSSRTIAYSTRPDLDGRMPRVSKWER
jgi:hypothetical protein